MRRSRSGKWLWVFSLLSMSALAEGSPAIKIATEEVVPGKLSVSVHAHVISGMRCWTFSSKGLWPLGQRELVFTVKQDEDEPDELYPRELLAFYRSVYDLASGKRFVDIGGFTQLR